MKKISPWEDFGANVLKFSNTKRVDGHRQKSSSICKHYFSEHNSNVPPCFLEQFHVLPKCSNTFDCLINEMLVQACHSLTLS